MCGIAGILGRAGELLEGPMEGMLQALQHRGPDHSARTALPTGILGHTRLAIVDLDGGAQPMASHDGRCHVTFNGEIYGYRALRDKLAGYPYRTLSDTEVILAAYEKYGNEAPTHLPGMFAFAVWDSLEQKLLCARDRLGEKPFYYAIPEPGVIVFASELKAILASGLVKPTVDRAALAYYFRRHYIHPWKTIYSNVFSLPPGHRLVWDGRRAHVDRYWRLPSKEINYTLDSAAEVLRHLLTNAVRSQLVADVEVGAFLSGGLDSTTIVSLAAGQQADLRTFCAEFEGQLSEATYAHLAADKFGTRHHDLKIKIDTLPDLLKKLAHVYDEPFADSSCVPTYLISEEARKYVKVVLTGDGSDELFGGYYWYRLLSWAERNPAPSYLRWMTGRVIARASRIARMPMGERLEQRNIGIGMAKRHKSIMDAHVAQMTFCEDEDLVALGLGDCIEEIEMWDEPLLTGRSVSGAMKYDIQTYLPGDILTKVDRASMAHGLELRAPFLDVDLCEFVLSLPANLRVTHDEDKRVLRAAFSAEWPSQIRMREKHGFGAPVSHWLQSAALEPMIQELVMAGGSQLNGTLDCAGLRDRYRKSGGLEKWAIFTLALWADHWRGSYSLAK